MGLICKCWTFVRFHFGHFLRGPAVLSFAFVSTEGDGVGRPNMSISKSSEIVGMLSIMFFPVYLGRNWFLSCAQSWSPNWTLLTNFPFLLEMIPDARLAVLARSFLQKLVCLLWKFVLCYRKCLAFVVVYVDVKAPVFCEAFVPWVPLLVTCHSMLFDTRGEMLAVSPQLLFPPFLLWAEQV